MFTYPIRPPLSQRTKDCARSWGDSEAARLPALPLQALLPLPLPGRPGLAYLLISPRPEAPGWRRRSSPEVDEAKPPSLTTTDVDSDSSNRPPHPQAGPSAPRGAGGVPHSLSVLVWQRCIPASPVAPALLFTLQIAEGSTPAFRGQGAAALRHRAAQACLSCPGTCACTRAQSPFA